MKKLKDICLSVLINEGEVPMSVAPGEVSRILDVDFDKEDIKISFETSHGKKADLVIKLEDFKSWVVNNKEKFQDVFKYFVVDFISNSQEGDEGLNEIVDDAGNIDLDDAMPNNATNSMVIGPKFDLEKIYKKFVPKSVKFYSGGMGIGAITW